MVVIRYHTSGPDPSDPYHNYNASENNARSSYYGISYVPDIMVDGSINGGSDPSTWGNRIRTEMAVSSPITMSITGVYNRTTHNGSVTVSIAAVDSIVNTNLKLRIAITESNINWLGPNGTRYHNQTFRDLTPSASGIAFTIARGDTVERTQSFSCPSPLVMSNCTVVAFVQSDTGHRILQGTKKSVISMSYNLNAFSLISPANHDTLPTCFPTCLWHASADPDSGYAVRYMAELSLDPAFENPYLSDTLSDTTWTCPVCLMSDTAYYWRVAASNGHAPEKLSTETFTFIVHEAGGCVYVPGDINGSGIANGIDVIYGVNYFKSGAIPPVDCHPACVAQPDPFYAAGDVNGNCVFNGIDITYFINYLKGQIPELTFCPNCPPSSRIAGKSAVKVVKSAR